MIAFVVTTMQGHKLLVTTASDDVDEVELAVFKMGLTPVSCVLCPSFDVIVDPQRDLAFRRYHEQAIDTVRRDYLRSLSGYEQRARDAELKLTAIKQAAKARYTITERLDVESSSKKKKQQSREERRARQDALGAQRTPGPVSQIPHDTSPPLPVIPMPEHVGVSHLLHSEVDRKERAFLRGYSSLAPRRSRRYEGCGA